MHQHITLKSLVDVVAPNFILWVRYEHCMGPPGISSFGWRGKGEEEEEEEEEDMLEKNFPQGKKVSLSSAVSLSVVRN